MLQYRAGCALLLPSAGRGIAPKTNLLIYLVVSLALIFLWRLILYPRLFARRSRDEAALIGSGHEADELLAEVNGNPRYRLGFSVRENPEDLSEEMLARVARLLRERGISVVVIDTEHPRVKEFLPQIYALSSVRHPYDLLEFSDLYEEVFDRIPLSLLGP